jgi:hypothetical protein
LSNRKTNEKLFELFDYNKKILYNIKFIRLFVFDTYKYDLSIEDDIYNLEFRSNLSHNQKIDSNFLPHNLIHLTFGMDSHFLATQIIEKNVLPNSLTHLTFSDYCIIDRDQVIEKYVFNQVIKKDVLPNSLKYLTFGNGFNQVNLFGTYIFYQQRTLNHSVFSMMKTKIIFGKSKQQTDYLLFSS